MPAGELPPTEQSSAPLQLPGEPYDLAMWKQVAIGRDCYINLEKTYYSAPYRLVGQQVWMREGLTSLHIYANHQLKAVHPRARQPGERYTLLDPLPLAKVIGLTTAHESCAARAAEIDPDTDEVVTCLLAQQPVDRPSMVQRLLRLADKHGALRLERACQRALQWSVVAR